MTKFPANYIPNILLAWPNSNTKSSRNLFLSLHHLPPQKTTRSIVLKMSPSRGRFIMVYGFLCPLYIIRYIFCHNSILMDRCMCERVWACVCVCVENVVGKKKKNGFSYTSGRGDIVVCSYTYRRNENKTEWPNFLVERRQRGK